jgi:hypothetical protein
MGLTEVKRLQALTLHSATRHGKRLYIMTKKDLTELKRVVRKAKTDADTINIQGKDFSCNWNGKAFEWTASSKETYLCTAKEVCNFIDDGHYIVSYYADIRNDLTMYEEVNNND